MIQCPVIHCEFSDNSAMAINACLCFHKPSIPYRPIVNALSPSFPPARSFRTHPTAQTQPRKPVSCGIVWNPKTMVALFGAGLTMTLVGPASAAGLPLLNTLQLSEPSNALSLPTWAVHVSSVVEWITAMALVWQYAEKSGNESWKGLSWGMVPLLGGAFCACTWHFFYNSESLEVLVALQAALTVIGNATMCIAAFRIYRSSEERSNNQ